MPKSAEMERDTILQILSESKLFGSLDTNRLQHLIDETEIVTWEKGDTIDSDLGIKYLHIILSGRLKITQIDAHTGRSITLFLLAPGDIFDIFSLLDGKEHLEFPVAMDRLIALRVPLDRAREWLCEYPAFNRAFLPYLGEMMRSLEAFAESMIFHDTSTRLANLILKHALPKKDPTDNHYPVRLIHNLSHESLAEMIGSVRSVVTSQIQKLKKEGIIISRRGHLAIKDMEKLLKKSDLFSHCNHTEHPKRP